MWVGIIQSIEGLNRTKRQRKGWILSPFLTAWAEIPVFSCPWTYIIDVPGSQAFGFRLDLHTPLTLSLQFAESKLWNFSGSIIQEPIPRNKPLSIYSNGSGFLENSNTYVEKSLHLELKFQSSSTGFILAFSFLYFTPFLQLSLIYLIIWSVPFYVANLPKQPGSHWLRCPPHPGPTYAGLLSHAAPLPSSCMVLAATGLSNISKSFKVIHLFLKYLLSTYYVSGVFPGDGHKTGRQTKFPDLTELIF